ncbi:lamina-associated polypeptide 2, isoforms beta/gamma-like [Apostichopus japonicus]|uniref:lamina-associated polypeptide 2, isoforms beta/gamma-like n=1 Tax=Stichopus japonicus TaxID=307972 RepID=UPI003AB199F8
MPSVVKNPERLTVQQLKKELQRKKVSIPTDARKDTYVQLYRKHILKEGRGFGFSSDEDDQPSVSAKRVTVTSQMYQSSSRTPSSRKGAYKIIYQDKLSDVEDLTDRKLRSELLQRGTKVGPIVPTTRPVYERKLADLLVQEVEEGETNRSKSTMVSFHDDGEEEEDEEDEEEDDDEEDEEEEEFSDSDVERDRPVISGRGDSRLQRRYTTQQQESTSSRSTVYRSSSVKKSKSQNDTKQLRYCCGLPLWLWWLVILAGVAGFIYCVWYSMEASKAPTITNDPKDVQG